MFKRIAGGMAPLAFTILFLAAMAVVEPMMFRAPGFCISTIYLMITTVYLMILTENIDKAYSSHRKAFDYLISLYGVLSVVLLTYGFYHAGRDPLSQEYDKHFQLFCIFFIPAIQLQNSMLSMVVDDFRKGSA